MKVILITIGLTAILSLGSRKAFSQVAANITDSLALVDFYNSTNGDSWTNNSGWLVGPVSTWYGVGMDTSGNVTSVIFYGNNTIGTLPASIGNLSHLVILTITGLNGGNLPSSLGNLSNLTQLVLEGSIVSNIPLEIGNLTNLTWLTLESHNFYGDMPSSIFNLHNLTGLFIGAYDSSTLSGAIPTSIGSLSNLTYLNITIFFNGPIPATIGNLTNLSSLTIEDNNSGPAPSKIGPIPNSIYNLTKLTQLSLFGLFDDTISNSIQNLVNLTTLEIAYLKKKGKIPESIGKLVNLTNVQLVDDSLAEPIPSSFFGLKNLKTLDLDVNLFNFDGLEQVASAYPFADYIVQESPRIDSAKGILSVTAGGMLRNNTYQWYKNGSLVSTKVGDSTYTPNSSGSFKVLISNAVATMWSLHSDTIYFSGPLPSFSIIDPFDPIDIGNSMIESDGSLNVDPESIDYLNQTRIGAATDGVTKLLLVAKTNKTITFSLSSSADGKLGSLSNPNYVDPNITTTTVAPDSTSGYVIGVFTAPDGYGPNSPYSGRSVNINISDANSPSQINNLTIKLVPPPLVMVHGMWASPGVWEPFVNFLKSNQYPAPALVNYSGSLSVSTFMPNDPGSAEVRGRIRNTAVSALASLRNGGYAVSKADFVCHSLGGLMTKSFSVSDEFIQNENYYGGYIHKLITLGTPHEGSPLGPYLYNRQFTRAYRPSLDGSGEWVPTSYTVASITPKLFGGPIGPCLNDFAKNSAALQAFSTDALAETPPYYTYSIVGNYLGNGNTVLSPAYIAINQAAKIIGNISFSSLFASQCPPYTIVPNDLIVPTQSQVGGLLTTVTFLGTGHCYPSSITEPNNNQIQSKVLALLLSANAADFSQKFPAYVQDNSCGLAADSFTPAAVAKTTSPSTLVAQNAGDLAIPPGAFPLIQLTEPSNGATYQRNSQQSITLNFQCLNGAVPTSALFSIPNVELIAAPLTPPYTVSFPLPANTPVGILTVLAIAEDTTGVIMFDTTSIMISPDGNLDSLQVQPHSIALDSSLHENAIYVEGFFNNGQPSNVIDLTAGSTGTTYRFMLGNNVASVSADGIVTAINPGTDTLLVSNGGLSVIVPVSVQNSFTSTTLFANSITFPAIPPQIYSPNLAFGLAATASSGDRVNFTIVAGPATIQNGVISITGPGTVTVTASDPGNAYFFPAAAVSQSFCVDPTQAASIRGDSLTCLGTANYSIPAATGMTYNWSLSGGGSLTINDSGAIVQWTDTGTHVIYATPVEGTCTGNPSVLYVTVTGPLQPTITQSGNALFSSAPSSNQWFLNQAPIAGATDSVYYPPASGYYSVQQSAGRCTSPPSFQYYFQGPGAADSLIQIYPNPFGSSVHIENNGNDPLTVEFFDMSGRQLMAQNSIIGSFQIATSGFTTGCYILVITDEITRIRTRRLLLKLK